MRAPIVLVVYGFALYPTTHALITLSKIRYLTELTDECRDRILESGEVLGGSRNVLAGGSQQSVLSASGRDWEDGDDVEDAVAATLTHLSSALLLELEKPISSLDQDPLSQKECTTVKKEYHQFLASTTRFLHVVQERQLKWNWSSKSTVFDGLSWMQGLWASRHTNTQNRSFIEQQMSLYAATACFGKSKEVLRRDVEVVEYLNDLIDSFG